MNIGEYKAQMAARAAMLERERGPLSQNTASNDEAKRDKPSERLSALQIERAAEMLRDYELQHNIVGPAPWENLNEKIKQHFRGKVRVVVDSIEVAE